MTQFRSYKSYGFTVASREHVVVVFLFFLMIGRPPRSTLFPNTTSSRSGLAGEDGEPGFKHEPQVRDQSEVLHRELRDVRSAHAILFLARVSQVLRPSLLTCLSAS